MKFNTWTAADCNTNDTYNACVHASVEGDAAIPAVVLTSGGTGSSGCGPQSIGPNTALALAAFLIAFAVEAKGRTVKDVNITIKG